MNDFWIKDVWIPVLTIVGLFVWLVITLIRYTRDGRKKQVSPEKKEITEYMIEQQLKR